LHFTALTVGIPNTGETGCQDKQGGWPCNVRSGLDGSERQKALNRIQSKHLDFVACDPETFAVRFVVELDDKSHGRADRQDRDQFLDQAMQAAGIPIFHFPVKRNYAVADIRAVLKGA